MFLCRADLVPNNLRSYPPSLYLDFFSFSLSKKKPHSLSGGTFPVPLNKGNEGSGNKIGLNRFSDFNVASSRYFNLFTGPEG